MRRMCLALVGLVLAAALTVSPSATAAVVSCSLPDKSFQEHDAGIFAPSFKADCTGLVPHDLLFHIRTADGTAVAPDDYTALDMDAGPNGQELEVVAVIIGDAQPEPNETFTLTVSDPSGRVSFSKPTATITIVDDDKPRCSIDDASFLEGDGGPVVRQLHAECDQPLTQDLNLQVTTADGTAVDGQDYVGINGPGSVAAGQTSWSPDIQILGDTLAEADETFTYTVSDPAGTVFFAKDTATITILDDDTPAAPCILLSDDHGNATGTASTPTQRGIARTAFMNVTNCGRSRVELNARGTDATGNGATWQLTSASSGESIDSTCNLGPNLFRADLVLWVGNGGAGTPLATQDTTVQDMSGDPFVLLPSATQEFTPEIELPCVGSDNLGEPMTMNITLTALAP